MRHSTAGTMSDLIRLVLRSHRGSALYSLLFSPTRSRLPSSSMYLLLSRPIVPTLGHHALSGMVSAPAKPVNMKTLHFRSGSHRGRRVEICLVTRLAPPGMRRWLNVLVVFANRLVGKSASTPARCVEPRSHTLPVEASLPPCGCRRSQIARVAKACESCCRLDSEPGAVAVFVPSVVALDREGLPDNASRIESCCSPALVKPTAQISASERNVDDGNRNPRVVRHYRTGTAGRNTRLPHQLARRPHRRPSVRSPRCSG